MAERLVARLLAGESLALVSDAGTPLVSDPGYRLVRAAREAGIRVSPVPGPCAFVAALSVAGLPSDRFVLRRLPAGEGGRAPGTPARAGARNRARWRSTNRRTGSRRRWRTWRRRSVASAAPCWRAN